MRVLVTGATGFVGQRLVEQLAARGHRVRAAVRRDRVRLPDGVEMARVADLGPATDWNSAVAQIDAVVHTAAVDTPDPAERDQLAFFRRVNTDGTLRLAHQAVAAGARRFVFLSTVKVNGDHTTPGRPFTPNDAPRPVEPYEISKLEAEQGLRGVAEKSGLEVAIVRPVLVYGPRVPKNFNTLLRLVYSGIPLPFGAIHNKRSLLALDNLLDFIGTCLEHPAAVNRAFLVSDDDDLSTTELLERVAEAMGKPARLLPIPTAPMAAAARLFGKRQAAASLFDWLQVDVSDARRLLGWSPVTGVDDALRATTDDFVARMRARGRN